MFSLILVQFIALPDRKDALLSNSKIPPRVFSSGSLGFYADDSQCVPTFPNYTLIPERKFDWCSNLATGNQMPWIVYTIPSQSMKLTGFSIRNGCCDHHHCCCDTETGMDYDFRCCCDLYSFSLQGSNDNQTWKTIHSVVKDKTFHWCEYKTYEFPLTESFKYIRIYMDEEYPNCQKCLQLNQVELYGHTHETFDYNLDEQDNQNEESVSIIGKIKRY